MATASRVFQRFLDQEAARRVANRFLWAMSTSDAKKTLGIPLSENPSEEEVNKIYRQRIKDVVRANPADLVNQVGMRDLNIAKSTLLGEFNRDRYKENPPGAPDREGPDWKPEDRVKREPPEPAPVPEGTTFASMLSSLGNVEWKIITDGAYKTDVVVEQEEAPRKTYFAYTAEFILVGRDTNHYVFAKITRRQNSREAMGWDRSDPVYRWDAFKTGFPLSKDLIKIAPKAIKSLREGAHRQAKYKVIEHTLTEKLVNAFRGTLSLLDAINGSGLLAEGADDSALKGRKLQIEIEPVLDQVKYKAWRSTPGRHLNSEMWNLNDWFVYVNGKKHQLKDHEVEKLFKNHFLFSVYSYDYQGKKNLTKLKGSTLFKPNAKEALERLADGLDSGPLRTAIEAAAAASPARK